MSISTYKSINTGCVTYKVTVTKKRNGVIIARKYNSFTRLNEAKAWERGMRSHLDNAGRLGDAITEFSTIKEAAELLIRFSDQGFFVLGKTERSNLRVLTSKRSVLRNVALIDLNEKHIYDFCYERRGPSAKEVKVSPQTTWSNLTTLSLLLEKVRSRFGVAVNAKLLRDRDLIKGLERENLISKSQARKRRVAPNEITNIYEALLKREKIKKVKIPYTLLFLLSLSTAMRISEIVTITYEEIDFEKKIIKLTKFKGASIDGSNKALQPLIRGSFELLKQYISERKISSGRVFNFTAGGVTKAFRAVLKELKIQDLRYHDLRRESISQLIDMQIAYKSIMSVSRHKSVQVFEAHYSSPDVSNLDDKLNGKSIVTSHQVLSQIINKYISQDMQEEAV
ncbi:hypothetical protein GMES_1220 [Paraglaciecola mesophila KMM 241]|uniref:Tyr recombinase domain-containing protein n=1 Tax=Paraglaciecola mesophila KMM 241 TaxID=1128912 RepID=K6XSB8_9ALTE|nr:site-specific integrase [Paraglaciecola mesophila]GAC23519.1 hypothetical protein GMES_1220 [Paraglaciecola mesophila KMM 241]